MALIKEKYLFFWQGAWEIKPTITASSDIKDFENDDSEEITIEKFRELFAEGIDDGDLENLL